LFFVLDQYADLDRKLKTYNNLLINQNRTDKQWAKTKCENINNDGP